MMAIVRHGFIKTAALPVAPAAKTGTAPLVEGTRAVLKQITFFDPVV